MGFEKDMITVKNIVLGYKISYKHYDIINYLITCIAYTIYKAYYISDLKTTQVNLLNLLKHDINMIISMSKYKHNNVPRILTLVFLTGNFISGILVSYPATKQNSVKPLPTTFAVDIENGVARAINSNFR